MRIRLLVVITITVFTAHLSLAKNVTDLDREARIDAMIDQIYPKVEIHLHFEGTVQHKTAYELLKKRNLPILGDGSEGSFIEAIEALPFVDTYRIFLSAIRGDLEAIERVAYELCEMQAEQGVIYSELHYPPHFLLVGNEGGRDYESSNRITVRDVVRAVNKGLDQGQRRFKVVIRSVLTIIRLRPEWANEILALAVQFRDEGVVGIDMAAFLGVGEPDDRVMNETMNFQPEMINVYKLAREYGIKRTVHVGFWGPPEYVIKAIEVLKVNRISHGYRILEDENLYKKVIELGVHFEGSPSTAESFGMGQNNPIVRYARDGASFSASSDFPTASKTNLTAEYRLLAAAGLSVRQMQLSNIKAMRNAFADKDLKRDILDILYKSYGLDPYEETESDNQRRKQPIIISRPVQVPAKVQNVTQVPEKQITSSAEAPNSNQPKVQVIATQTPKVVVVVESNSKYFTSQSQIAPVSPKPFKSEAENLPDSYCTCSQIPFIPIISSHPLPKYSAPQITPAVYFHPQPAHYVKPKQHVSPTNIAPKLVYQQKPNYYPPALSVKPHYVPTFVVQRQGPFYAPIPHRY